MQDEKWIIIKEQAKAKSISSLLFKAKKVLWQFSDFLIEYKKVKTFKHTTKGPEKDILNRIGWICTFVEILKAFEH